MAKSVETFNMSQDHATARYMRGAVLELAADHEFIDLAMWTCGLLVSILS